MKQPRGNIEENLKFRILRDFIEFTMEILTNCSKSPWNTENSKKFPENLLIYSKFTWNPKPVKIFVYSPLGYIDQSTSKLPFVKAKNRDGNPLKIKGRLGLLVYKIFNVDLGQDTCFGKYQNWI